MHLLAILGTICLSLLASKTAALGINCRGSFQCVFLTDNPAQSVVGFITGGIDQNTTFNDGELIACSGFICAFLQGTGGLDGAAVLALAPQITGRSSLSRYLFSSDSTGHGCNQCGSVPIGFPTTNDVANGQLTINAVGGCNPCANGRQKKDQSCEIYANTLPGEDGLCPPNTGGDDGGDGIICTG
jgi:hypothetical protein